MALTWSGDDFFTISRFQNEAPLPRGTVLDGM